MPRSLLFAALAALAAASLTACNAELNTAPQGVQRTGLAERPAVGALVQLHLVSGGQVAIGTVTAFEGDAIVLSTEPSGTLVANWPDVVAWESGESVERRQMLMESIELYRADTTRMIEEIGKPLPGER